MPFKPIPLLLLALLGAGDAAAIGLGEITILSRLGERFRAEVQLIENADDDRPLSECFRLSQPADPDAPVLTHGRVAVEGRGGKRRLLISSGQTINDPVLQLSLRAGCGAEVVRNYLVLIDPAAEVAAPAAARKGAGTAAVQAQAAAAPTRKRPYSPESATPSSDGRAALDRPASADEVPPGPARLPRKKPASMRPPAEGRLAYRLVISGDDAAGTVPPDGLSLRLASELGSRRSEKTSDGQRAIFRMEYKLLTALYDRTSEQLNLAEQVRNLESSLAELQAATANATVQAAPPAASPAPSAEETRAALPAAAAQPRSGQKAAAPAGGNAWWLEMAALFGLIAVLVLVLRQRALRPVIAPHNLAAEVLEPAIAETLAVADDAPAIKPAPLTTRNFDDTQVVPAAPLDGNRHLSGHSEGATVLTEAYEFNPVMELADIMLSFGRLKGAAQALQEYIAQNPNEALQPWLKLLEIYRQGNMREEFESVAEKLKLHFNVAPVAWEAGAELSPAPVMPADATAGTLEALLPLLPNIAQHTHICEELARHWNSSESIGYLNKLLRDNRNGERRGFNPAMVGELLFLMDLLDRRLKG